MRYITHVMCPCNSGACSDGERTTYAALELRALYFTGSAGSVAGCELHTLRWYTNTRESAVGDGTLQTAWSRQVSAHLCTIATGWGQQGGQELLLGQGSCTRTCLAVTCATNPYTTLAVTGMGGKDS